jgi:Fe2+ or Zn2+ uptake regulation protein
MQLQAEEQNLIRQLRRCRLRATNQRLAVMRNLVESRSHLSAEEIYQRLKPSHPTLSLSTVYKTLQVMAEMGAVVTIETGTGSLKFDGQTHPHHHAVCRKCGQVFDVDFKKCPVDPENTDILPGFQVQAIKVYFTGTCEYCPPVDGQPSAPVASD